MKVLIASALAAGLVFVASATFAQMPGPTATPGPTASPGPTATPGPNGAPGPIATPGAPGVHPNMGKGEDHAENHQRWEDCMRQQEAKYGGVKTVGPNAGANNNKGNYKGLSKGKPMPPDEKADAKKGEKENRHQAEMDDCREQLYGRDGPPAGKK